MSDDTLAEFLRLGTQFFPHIYACKHEAVPERPNEEKVGAIIFYLEDEDLRRVMAFIKTHFKDH